MDSETRDTMRDMKYASTDVLLNTAADIVAQKTKNSAVFDATAEARVPKFDMQSIKLGKVLGRGGFCVVREIERIRTCEMSSEGSIFS